MNKTGTMGRVVNFGYRTGKMRF